MYSRKESNFAKKVKCRITKFLIFKFLVRENIYLKCFSFKTLKNLSTWMNTEDEKNPLGGVKVLNNWDCDEVCQNKPLKMVCCLKKGNYLEKCFPLNIL